MELGELPLRHRDPNLREMGERRKSLAHGSEVQGGNEGMAMLIEQECVVAASPVSLNQEVESKGWVWGRCN